MTEMSVTFYELTHITIQHLQKLSPKTA